MSINTSTMRHGAAYEGDQRAKLPVYASGEESGNKVLNMDHPMRELYIANDSTTNSLTLQVTGNSGLDISITLKPEDTIDERFPEFHTVTITATDSYRWYVRSGRIT